MGRALQPIFPLSVMWVLLMHRLSRSMAPVDAMCCSVDSKLWYNAALYRLLGLTHLASAFAGDGLRTERASRVMAVELLPQDIEPQDPLGADLGGKRILRTSPLTAVPAIC